MNPAYHQGCRARRAGGSFYDRPYARNSKAGAWWSAGWNDEDHAQCSTTSTTPREWCEPVTQQSRSTAGAL